LYRQYHFGIILYSFTWNNLRIRIWKNNIYCSQKTARKGCFNLLRRNLSKNSRNYFVISLILEVWIFLWSYRDGSVE
jgi:hypothetical protein